MGIQLGRSFHFEMVLRFVCWTLAITSFFAGLITEDRAIGLAFTVVASFYQLGRLVVYLAGTVAWKLKSPIATSENSVAPPLVSIIVPCFNEESVLFASLSKLDQIDYPSFEIIVVDDGSLDKTYGIAEAFSKIASHPVRVLHHSNSGKAASLNLGVAAARGEYVLCVDSDSLIAPCSIKAGLKHLLRDQRIVAVAGAVHVANQESWLTIYQAVEYGLGDLQKACLSCFGAVPVIPGPVGLFRKSALVAAGGYEVVRPTFAEDTELTLRLIAHGGRVMFEPRMISRAEVPESWSALIRQRYRWTRGIYQALRNNLRGLKGSFLVYVAMEKVWAPVADFCLLMFFLGQFIAFAEINFFMQYNLAVFGLEALSLLAAGWYSRRKMAPYFVVLLISRFTFSIVITTWKFLSLQEEWQKLTMTWDKLDRKGFALLERPS